MTTKVVRIEDFEEQLKRDLEELERKIATGIRMAAVKAVPHIKDRTPKAFGELRDGTHAVLSSDDTHPAQIRVDAPHAQAVEIGSRPHVVPLEELVAWVKLRGMQALKGSPKTKMGHDVYGALHGTSTLDMSRQVGRALRALERNGANDVDAPEQVARAIQRKIAKVGTRPHHYVRGSLDTVVREALATELAIAVK